MLAYACLLCWWFGLLCFGVYCFTALGVVWWCGAWLFVLLDLGCGVLIYLVGVCWLVLALVFCVFDGLVGCGLMVLRFTSGFVQCCFTSVLCYWLFDCLQPAGLGVDSVYLVLLVCVVACHLALWLHCCYVGCLLG